MPGFGKDGKGQILYSVGRGSTSAQSLAAGSVATFGGQAPTEDIRILRMDGHIVAEVCSSDDVIIVGLADGELTDAEIEECLEAQAVDANDNVALERSHRPVWVLGRLQPTNEGTVQALDFAWDKRWTFSDGEGWTLWAYNLGATALAAGVLMDYFVKFFGVWVK